MKKLFALLFFLGAVTAVFAQNNRSRNESRDVILGQRNDRTVYEDRRNDGYYTERDLNARIQKINSEYNWRIESVRNDRHLRKAEKKRQIRVLEDERNERIRQARERYYNRDDRSYKNDRNDRNRTRY